MAELTSPLRRAAPPASALAAPPAQVRVPRRGAVPSPAASSVTRSPRRKFFPSSPGLSSRDQLPRLPESLKVTEEISTDTATRPPEDAPRFPAALAAAVSALITAVSPQRAQTGSRVNMNSLCNIQTHNPSRCSTELSLVNKFSRPEKSRTDPKAENAAKETEENKY